MGDGPCKDTAPRSALSQGGDRELECGVSGPEKLAPCLQMKYVVLALCNQPRNCRLSLSFE